jgi:glycosyltransferase involved in cell wall biosynthesis
MPSPYRLFIRSGTGAGQFILPGCAEYREKDFRGNHAIYSQHRIGVVIPAYNEEDLIKTTISSVPAYVDRIYVVDDGSADATWEQVKECAEDLRLITIRHERNSGVGAAITTGYKQALRDGLDIVNVVAGDNQMDPKYLPYLLDPIVWKMADYTKGNRLVRPELREGMSLWRSFGNSLLRRPLPMTSSSG